MRSCSEAKRSRCALVGIARWLLVVISFLHMRCQSLSGVQRDSSRPRKNRYVSLGWPVFVQCSCIAVLSHLSAASRANAQTTSMYWALRFSRRDMSSSSPVANCKAGPGCGPGPPGKGRWWSRISGPLAAAGGKILKEPAQASSEGSRICVGDGVSVYRTV